MTQRLEMSANIQSPLSEVWNALTNPDQMRQWMGEPEMEIEIVTDWIVGNSIVIKGFHHVRFENKGTILQFEPNSVFTYDYLSSISQLPDKPENRTVVEFILLPNKHQTTLNLILSNFPSESIYKHVEFYWKGTLEILKKMIEGHSS